MQNHQCWSPNPGLFWLFCWRQGLTMSPGWLGAHRNLPASKHWGEKCRPLQLACSWIFRAATGPGQRVRSWSPSLSSLGNSVTEWHPCTHTLWKGRPSCQLETMLASPLIHTAHLHPLSELEAQRNSVTCPGHTASL